MQLTHSRWSVLAFNAGWGMLPWHKLLLDKVGAEVFKAQFQQRPVVVGVDVGRPGGDKTVYTHVRYDTAQIIIIDDVQALELTEEQREKMLEQWRQRSNRALEASFCIVDDPLNRVETPTMKREPKPFRAVPYYRQQERQLNGRRR